MCQKFDFLLSSVELLQPEYFEDQILIWFFKTIKEYHLDYDESPSPAVLRNEMQKALKANKIKDQDEDLYTEVLAELPVKVDDQAYRTNEVIRFCRRTAMRNLWLENAKKLDQADDDFWDHICDSTNDVATIGTSFMDMGTHYFQETNERIRKRLMDEEKLTIPTGITELDYKINGGLRAGQLGIWMGGTGAGKSIALPHCGKRAIINGYKVVHYTLELDEEEIARRYDASWTGVNIGSLKKNSKEIQSRLSGLYTKHGDSLVIKAYPTMQASTTTIRSHLKILKGMGFVPDLIIVDYGDLLKPTSSYNDPYADLGNTFAELRGIAGEWDVPLWTATQVNRAGMSQEIADVDSIGDSVKKAQIADLLIAICATREELENNELRLFGAKNRNGPPKFLLSIKSDYERMCFYRPGGHNALPAANPPPTMPAAPPAAVKPKVRRKAAKIPTAVVVPPTSKRRRAPRPKV